MRLINVDTWQLTDFSSAIPKYAILSHTWEDDEVSYQDFQDLELAQTKDGFDKINYLCSQARAHGLQYAWIDTVCINKTSSAELAEAINSMWSYYMNCAVCYVYLSDVPASCPPLTDGSVPISHLTFLDAFEDSRWFSRGWTLQELLAPRYVHFFGSAWDHIGPLSGLIRRVSDITGIQQDVLSHTQPLADLCLARRLSWAAQRQTTRVEDMAYSLFGILGVNMPLLYGEGGRAFLRLQEEVIKRSTDQSLFAWDAPPGLIDSHEQLLAPTPACFMNSGRIRQRVGSGSKSKFWLSNKGLEITLPIIRRQLIQDPTRPDVTLGILDCTREGSPDVLALVMSQHPYNIQAGVPTMELYVSGYRRRSGSTLQYARLMAVHKPEALCAQTQPLTITNNLRDQPYMQACRPDSAMVFPVWFQGADPSSVPNLVDIFPEDSWSPNTSTMVLRAHESYGAIVIDVEEHGSVLVVFGLANSMPSIRSVSRPPIRRIYGMVSFDRKCQIEPHLRSVAKERSTGPGDIAHLLLTKDRRLVSRLSRSSGPLTVELGRCTDDQVFTSSPIVSSPPASPSVSRRTSSFSTASRRDSVMSGSRSYRSDSSNDEVRRAPHYARRCDHCQFKKVKNEHDRRIAKERETARRKTEKQQALMSKAKSAGMTFTLGSMVADGFELLL